MTTQLDSLQYDRRRADTGDIDAIKNTNHKMQQQTHL